MAMLLDAIQSKLEELSKAERRVAKAILEEPQNVLAGNITLLAKKASVSEPTVVRFCRAVGYQGWHDFKLKLAQGLAVALPGENEISGQNDVARDIVNKICSRSINTLLDLRNYLDIDAIQSALEILRKAKKIELYGQGASATVVMDAQHKFFRSGISALAYSDADMYTIAALLLQLNDAVVIISQRGDNPSLLRSAQFAKRNGANVITLAPPGTPLSSLATVSVPINLSASTDIYAPLSARLAHLVVIDIFAVGLALDRGQEFRQKMEDAHKLLYRCENGIDIDKWVWQWDSKTEKSEYKVL